MLESRRIGTPGLFSATLVAIHLFCLLMALFWKAGTACNPEQQQEEEEEEEEEQEQEQEQKQQNEEEEEQSVGAVSEHNLLADGFSAPRPRHECVLCLRPASKRCSRCKVVRYCSGKCQITHWRQSHKHKCQPAGTGQPLEFFSATSQDEHDSRFSDMERTSSSPQDSKLDVNMPRENASWNQIHSAEKNVSHSDSIIEETQPFITNRTESDCKLAHSAESNDDSMTHIPNASDTSREDSFLRNASSCTANPIVSCSFKQTIMESRTLQKAKSYSLDVHSFSDYVSRLKSENDSAHCDNGINDDNSTGTGNRSYVSSEHDLAQRDTSICNYTAGNSNISDNYDYGNADIDSSNRFDQTAVHSVSDESPRTENDFEETYLSRFAEDIFSSKISSSMLENGDRNLSSSSGAESSGLDEISEPENTSQIGSNKSSPLSEQGSSKGSLSTVTLKKSIESAFQYFSRHKAAEMASPNNQCTVKRGNQDSCHTTLPSRASSQQVGSGFKRSVKKVLLRAKLSKQSKLRSLDHTAIAPIKMLFPYEDFVHLFNWTPPELYPCGLVNCGNSCYANAILQCLIHTRPLAAYLHHGFHSKHCKRRNWCFMCELECLIISAMQGERTLSPINILSIIQRKRSHLGNGKQEDAHELLRLSIECMQLICLDEAGGEQVLSQATQKTTLIHQIFGGCLQSKIECLKCHYKSIHHESILDLAVEINGDIESLQDALAQFTAPEFLDGENKYKCDRCNSYVKAKKQLLIHEAPNILTIALKRFKGGKYGKINKHITFPELLELSPYISDSCAKQAMYKLYAVVVHLDILNSSFFGHYVCYVKGMQGTWFKIDDTEVQPVHINSLMSEGAYLLFYSRSSSRLPYVLNHGRAQTCKGTSSYLPSCIAKQQFFPVKQDSHFSFTRNVPLSKLENASIDQATDSVWNTHDFTQDLHDGEILNFQKHDFDSHGLSSAMFDWNESQSDKEHTYFTHSSSDSASWSTDSFRDSSTSTME